MKTIKVQMEAAIQNCTNAECTCSTCTCGSACPGTGCDCGCTCCK